MRIKHIMSSPAICIDENTTINQTINIMRERKIDFFPITKNDYLLGVVTDKDILFRSQNLNNNSKISKIMTNHLVYTVNENASIDIASKIMNKYKIKQLVVINDDYIKGVITINDIYKYKSSLINNGDRFF